MKKEDFDKIGESLTLLTGVTRSGTSFFGKVLGSFSNLEYDFEPMNLIWIPAMSKHGAMAPEAAGEFALSYVCELFIDKVLCRSYSMRPSDDSCILKYRSLEEIHERWDMLKNRGDALKYAAEKNIGFAMKMPNAQFFYSFYREVFPKIRFIHMVRHPFDVAQSVKTKGWMRDELLFAPASTFFKTKVKVGKKNLSAPFWLDSESAENFFDADEFSRGLIYWRIVMQAHLYSTAFKEKPPLAMEIKYEDLVSHPERIFRETADFLGKEYGTATESLLKGVRRDQFRAPFRPEAALKIANAELEKLDKAMSRYAWKLEL